MATYTLNLNPVLSMTHQQFWQLCQANPELKLERDRNGELVIMTPTGGETGNRNIELAAEFVLWNRQAGLGQLFDSSTGFQLPNGGDRSPDIAWIEQSRWDQLTSKDKEGFPPIAPDFVLELLSPSDRLRDAQAKMQEYQASGVRLGWMINRNTRQAEIYRLGQPVEVLDNPTRLNGEDVLPGLSLNVTIAW